MPMRLQEVHPSVVHFPIAFLPLAIGADALGLARRDRALLGLGRRAIGLAAASAGVAALTGLIAQEEVRADGRAYDMLVTHRNLNAAALAGLTGLALWRRGHRPGRGYLAAGLGLIGATVYSAYLGGNMVYERGVGVRPAGGLAGGTSPALTPSEAPRAVRTAARDLGRGVRHAWQELREGRIAPALRRDGRRAAASLGAASREAAAGAAGAAGLASERREELRHARIYTDLVLAAHDADGGRIDAAIESWGELGAPRIRGESLLELVLADDLAPVVRLRLVRALLRAGASVSERALDRAAASGDGRVFGPLLDAHLRELPEAERADALREVNERLFHTASNLRRVVRRRRGRETAAPGAESGDEADDTADEE